jgi:hypothetical protein
VEPTQLGPTDRGSLYLRTSATTGFIKLTQPTSEETLKMLTLIDGLCCVGFLNTIGVVDGVG